MENWLREELLKRRLIGEQVGSKITVPHSDVEKYYKEHQDEFVREERVFLSEILISTAGKEEKEIPALEKKAKSLVERARNGQRLLVRSVDGGQLGCRVCRRDQRGLGRRDGTGQPRQC